MGGRGGRNDAEHGRDDDGRDAPGRIGTGLRRHGLARRPGPVRRRLGRRGLRFTEGNAIALYDCGRAAFPDMLDAIRSAQHFVHLESYILRADRLGSRFLDALHERSRAGVVVRILYDGLGSRELPEAALGPLRRDGAEIIAFNPLGRIYPNWAPRRRDHRKTLIVDGVQGFTGGLNLGDEYDTEPYSEERAGSATSAWRDTHLGLRGPVVRDLGAVFLESWYRAGGPGLAWRELLEREPETAGPHRCAVLADGPVYRRRAMREFLIDSLAGAQESVKLTSPYFAPGRGVLEAMGRAAERGVRVELVVSGHRTDHPLLRRGARRSIERLLRRGVRVFEYETGTLHAKSAVFDGRLSIVGSSNLDRQSLHHNYEVNIVAGGDDLAGQLQRLFASDVEHSTAVTLEALEKRDWITRTVDSLAALVLRLIGEGDPLA